MDFSVGENFSSRDKKFARDREEWREALAYSNERTWAGERLRYESAVGFPNSTRDWRQRREISALRPRLGPAGEG
jgi:hypothetical protein